MSRISKRKLMKVLKGEYQFHDSVDMTKEQIFDMFKNPPTQAQWLKGYRKWVEEHTLSTPLSEYEAIQQPKRRRRKKNVND